MSLLKEFLFINNPINITIFFLWLGLLVYTIILTSKNKSTEIDENEKINNENEFNYITTLFCIFTLLNYFRYFPALWNSNNTMKIVNIIGLIGALTSLFFIINKNKLDEKSAYYKTKLIPLQGMLITLSVYTLHTALQGIKISPFDFFIDTDDKK